MLHKLHCQEPWFSLLRDGKKPVEGRKASAAYLKIAIGDQIRFFNGDEFFDCEVVGVNHYQTIEDYLHTETLARALPGVNSLAEGIKIYLQWSTREQIAKHGFLGIQIKLFAKLNASN